MKRFIDTNILVYAQQSERRSERARAIIAEGGVVSVQVLNEFVAVARRKLERTWPEVAAALADLRDALPPPTSLTVKTHEAAVMLAQAHSLGFYDALVVAAAIEAGCDELLSEDLQTGRRFGALRIVNPFAETA